VKPTSEAVRLLDLATVERTLFLLRSDPLLGRSGYSSWEEVTPSDYEAAERLRMLIEEGIVPIQGAATPEAILRALRAAEPGFWSLG
jgi:hypothetical protein